MKPNSKVDRNGAGKASLRSQREPVKPSQQLVSIPLYLFSAAQTEARYALHHYVTGHREEQRKVAIAAGAAVEYLMRCTLAAEDPVLLADKGAASMIAMSRAGRTMPLNPESLRSITFAEVMDRMYLIYATLGSRQRTEQVMRLRNAAIHMALVRDDLTQASVRSMVLIVDNLLEILHADDSHFWGQSLQPLLSRIRDDAATELSVRVQAAIANARRTYDQIMRDVPPSDRPRLATVLGAARKMSSDDDDIRAESADCIACASKASIIFQRYRTDPEETANGLWVVDVVFTLLKFACPVCGLELDEAELLESGMPFAQLDDEQEFISYALDDWEPDEDLLRGR